MEPVPAPPDETAATHYRRLERMYLGAPCNEGLGLEIAIGPGECRIALPVQQRLTHAAGAVHGSYLFKLLDDSAYFASNALVPDAFVLTVSFQVQLLRPVAEGVLHAHGTVIKPGRSLLFAESVVVDDGGREIVRGSGTFARSEHALSEVAGYR